MTLSRAQQQITADAIQRELAWREAERTLTFGPPDPFIAQGHLLEYMRLHHPKYLVGWFHRELCRELDLFSRAVTLEQSPRLVISAPPQHGKSEIVSRKFPVHHLGNNPGHKIALASYGQSLANDMSRDARSTRDDSATGDWEGLAPGDKNGVEHWLTADGSSFKAVGAGGALTGSGAHILILDDPIKNWEEAHSQTIRDSRWSWYMSTATTRMAPGGGILVMATRWHEDDISGRILKLNEQGLEKWRVVNFPGLAEEDEIYRKRGEALHPERYTTEALEQKRRVMPPRIWAALYQQRPTPDGGGIFERGWLTERFLHDPQRPPEPYDEIMVSIDATLTDAATSDFVAMVVIGRKGTTQFDVLDEVHDRMSYVGLRSAARDLIVKWRPSIILIERAASGHALIDELKSEFPAVIGFKPSEFGSKDTRAIMVTPLFEGKNVRFPKEGRFTSDFVEELASFPSGAHDDRVDALAQGLIHWTKKFQAGRDDRALTANLQDLAKAFGFQP